MVDEPATVELVDDSTPYGLRDLCEICAVRADVVAEMVALGILTAAGSTPSVWRFSVQASIRLQKAHRLQRDLNINLAGVALALDLLDDLDAMRKRVAMLERHLAQLANDT
jgi:chaperone modulatory protein CbpM